MRHVCGNGRIIFRPSGPIPAYKHLGQHFLTPRSSAERLSETDCSKDQTAPEGLGVAAAPALTLNIHKTFSLFIGQRINK
jgi:hypothetical protein